jgi:hypothetical protein
MKLARPGRSNTNREWWSATARAANPRRASITRSRRPEEMGALTFLDEFTLPGIPVQAVSIVATIGRREPTRCGIYRGGWARSRGRSDAHQCRRRKPMQPNGYPANLASAALNPGNATSRSACRRDRRGPHTGSREPPPPRSRAPRPPATGRSAGGARRRIRS